MLQARPARGLACRWGVFGLEPSGAQAAMQRPPAGALGDGVCRDSSIARQGQRGARTPGDATTEAQGVQ